MIHDDRVDWAKEHSDEGYGNCATDQRGHKPDDKFEAEKQEEQPIENMQGCDPRSGKGRTYAMAKMM